MPVIENFPKILHGGDYNPDQWLETPEVIDRDFEYMAETGCNCFSVGIFGWGQIEVEEGRFDFGWLDDIFERAEKGGVKLFLATPSAAKPGWMGMKYPETNRVFEVGMPRTPWITRQTNCLASPIFREKVIRINQELAKRYADHPALAGWHISNEYNGACYCENCLAEFHSFLRERYGTLEKLNRVWNTGFWSHRLTDWNQISPSDHAMDGAQLDWKRFASKQIIDFYRMEVAAVRKYSDKPATTNMMGIYTGVDYWKLAPYCDFITDDCYPFWNDKDAERLGARFSLYHDMHYTMGDKPFIMLESCPGVANYQNYPMLRRPHEFRREMFLALGHGADGTMYFQWRKGANNCEKIHGAVVGHDGGNQTMVFREVAAYGKTLEKLAPIVDSRRNPEIAVIYDWESNWAIETSKGYGKEDVKRIDEHILRHYRALWNRNYELAVIDSEQDFSRYKMVVAPLLYMLKPGVAERLETFVQNGGTLVMSYLSAYVDENNFCCLGGNPGKSLRKLFGIWNEDIDCFPAGFNQGFLWKGKRHAALNYAEYLHNEGAEVKAVYAEDFYAGTPAITENAVGKGRAVYLGVSTELDFLEEFYGDLAAESGVAPVLAGLPEGIRACRRVAANGDAFYFLANLLPQEVEVKLPFPCRDLDAGTDLQVLRLPARGTIVLQQK